MQLIDNWNLAGDALRPVGKIFSPVGSDTRLIASMNSQDEDKLYGLCDFGFGYPELGYVRLSELQNTIVPVPPAGIGPERDLHFKPSHSLSADAEAAQQNGAVTTPPSCWTRPKTAAKLPLKRIVETDASS